MEVLAVITITVLFSLAAVIVVVLPLNLQRNTECLHWQIHMEGYVGPTSS